MKLSLFATALLVLTLVACGKPHQANPESIEGYGTRTEEGTTVAEERAAAGEVSGTADPSTFDVKNAVQASDEVNDAVESVEGAAAAVEDEFSGKAVLPGHNLDGNGNPIVDGKDPTKLMH
jgi:hypothetical protein